TYFNLVLVFALCGLWHGASYNFLVWGLFHGAFLVFERLGLGALLARAPAALRHVYVLLVVMIGWVFFRADNLANAIAFLGNMVGTGGFPDPGRSPLSLWLAPVLAPSLAAAVIAATPVLPAVLRRFDAAARPVLVAAAAETVALLALAAGLGRRRPPLAPRAPHPFLSLRVLVP